MSDQLEKLFRYHSVGEVKIEPMNIPHDEIEEFTSRTVWPTITVSINLTPEECDNFLDLFEDPDWPNVLF